MFVKYFSHCLEFLNCARILLLKGNLLPRKGRIVAFMRSFLRDLSHALGCVAVSLVLIGGGVNAAFAACASNEIDVLGDGTQCETPKFEVTTTSDTTTLSWTMTATGTFYADCGDGGTLDQDTSSYGTISGNTIMRTGTSTTTYTCTWDTAGAHTIKFAGTATGYSTSLSAAAISFYKSSGGTQTKVAGISGSLGAMFPVVNGAIPRFYQTFYDCSNLTGSIPADLFSGIDTSSATNTSYMFGRTFYNCSGLTGSIPSGLFSGIDTSSATNTQAMFASTFYNCSGLTNPIPKDLFAGISTPATSQNQMMVSVFGGTNLAGTCGSYAQYITGFEKWFGGHVACDDTICNANEMNLVSQETSCLAPKFTVTTTSDATSLIFSLSASGTFYVDCGDGGMLSGSGVSGRVIYRENTNIAEYTCTWNSAGVHNVKFTGTATGYHEYATNQTSLAETNRFESTISFYKSSGGTQDKIVGVSGSFVDVFPIISGNNKLSFKDTFRGATNLQSISGTLFDGYAGASHLLFGTFANCTSLTSIPDNLFASFTSGGSYMFYQTFYGCTGLTSLPDNLFGNITTAGTNMFYQTFTNCSGMSGFIKPSTFAGLIAANNPSADGMWTSTFVSTNLDTSCPTGTAQYITGYESVWKGKVSCGCPAGFYGDGVSCSVCGNANPAHSQYSVSIKNPCTWNCDTGYHDVNGTCEALQCSSNEFIGGNACQQPKFTITTTPDTTSFSFSISAEGTFYIDWGDGNIQIINMPRGAGLIVYSHNYASGGEYNIRFAGVANAYYNNTDPSLHVETIRFYSAERIASVSGSLSALFPAYGYTVTKRPIFYQTFSGATNLHSVPDTLFSGYSQGYVELFYGTFMNSGLTSIPENLFRHVTVAAAEFQATFYGCTGLTSIPENLFSNISGRAEKLFSNTFEGCTGLTSIPENLFRNISGAPANNMFYRTFYGCTGLTGPIPKNLFAGISTSTTATNQMTNVFYNTNLATSCDPYAQYITGFEDWFDGHVACEDNVCASEYNMFNNQCLALCAGGFGKFKTSNGYEFSLYATKPTTPAMNFEWNGNVCYAPLETGSASGTFNFEASNGTTYHLMPDVTE